MTLIAAPQTSVPKICADVSKLVSCWTTTVTQLQHVRMLPIASSPKLLLISSKKESQHAAFNTTCHIGHVSFRDRGLSVCVSVGVNSSVEHSPGSSSLNDLLPVLYFSPLLLKPNAHTELKEIQAMYGPSAQGCFAVSISC